MPAPHRLIPRSTGVLAPMRALALVCIPLCTLALSACASKVATNKFKGEEHAVAQTIADLQSDVTAADKKKVCANDLAAVLVKHLGGAKRCESAIKDQLAEIDNLELTVQSVKLAAGGTSASAQVKSIRSGKSHASTLVLVKERGGWKISGLQ